MFVRYMKTISSAVEMCVTEEKSIYASALRMALSSRKLFFFPLAFHRNFVANLICQMGKATSQTSVVKNERL